MVEKITGEWMIAPETVALMSALSSSGATPRFVGGCVRDALIGHSVEDVDIAIDTDPNTVIRLLTDAEIRVIPTGFAHGTLTAVKGRRSYEVTSLRQDTSTDGRHADVSYTKDWAKDAARRDFTMNALYADADGTVHDFLGSGVADARARRVRFIGSASDRIQEDYLRILRLFRFQARYGEGTMEPDALVACAGLTGGLETLSRERVGSEMIKMLSAKRLSVALDMMEQTGVLIRVLPTARMAPPMLAMELLESRFGLSPNVMRRLAMITRGSDPRDTGRALRLSNDDMSELRARRAPERLVQNAEDARRLGYLRGEAAAQDAVFIQHAEAGTTPEIKTLKAIAEGAAQKLPVSSKDLMAVGINPGPELGQMLKKVETLWIESDFVLDKNTLVAQVRATA